MIIKNSKKEKQKKFLVFYGTALGMFAVIAILLNFFDVSIKLKGKALLSDEYLAAAILPEEGVTLPVAWNDLGKQLTDTGVIDKEQMELLYAERGGLTPEMKTLLYDVSEDNLVINEANAGYLLNLFWAFGLANKNPILEEGPMQDPNYGGAGNFASTGGWTLSKGDSMEHYSTHEFIKLTKKQQELVERVAKNIYRPCCGNSTYFPDCNHGMAMLGFLELMAAQNVSEEDMYVAALKVNSYWFPSTYMTIAKYLDKQDIDWEDAKPKDLLGASYSSSSGYRNILSQVEPATSSGGGSCGV